MTDTPAPLAPLAPELRHVMRNFATGVCVATTTHEDEVAGRLDDGVTINSLTSVSLKPPLVSLCLRPGSGFLTTLLETQTWALSILDAGAEDIARALAGGRHDHIVAIRTLSARRGERTGALILDAPSWLECTLWDVIPLGGHTMVVGEVVAAGVQPRRPPLIFLGGAYRLLDCA